MAHILAAAGGVNWIQGVQQAWGWVRAQSGAGIAFLAALPRDCQSASTHAALVCAGYVPEYFTTPGFPPLSLGWGWLLLGMFVGVVMTLLLLSMTDRLHRMPSLATLAHLAGNGQMPNNQLEDARQDLLRYVSTGRPALQRMASLSGMSEMELLRRAYAIAPAGAPPGISLSAASPGTNCISTSMASAPVLHNQWM